MKSNFRVYNHVSGAERIRSYLDGPDGNYQAYDEAANLPSRDALTYSNGFYCYGAALFIDIRRSSALPDKHKRPTLAKLYRAYISEMVAVLNSKIRCAEVNIVGDGVWAIFNTPQRDDIDEVFDAGYTANSMIQILNKELSKRSITTISVGIGMEYGRVLMVKAGYDGSGLNDVVYMGDVVNRAAHLAAAGNSTYSDKTFMVGDVFYSNLNDHNKGLLSWNSTRRAWHGEVIHTGIEEWTKDNY